MATALERGAVDLEHFNDEVRANSSVTQHISKVNVSVDQECHDAYPRLRAAKVRIEMEDGSHFHRSVDDPYGSAGNPLPDDALRMKFNSLVRSLTDEIYASELNELVWKMHDLNDVRDLLSKLHF